MSVYLPESYSPTSLNWQRFNRSTPLLSTIPGEKLQSCSIRPGEAVVHRRFDRDSTDHGSFILCTFVRPPLAAQK